jgi:lambda repressor-like predicted transcriptional regulator
MKKMDLKLFLKSHGETMRSASMRCGLGKNTLNRFYTGGVRDLHPKTWLKFNKVFKSENIIFEAKK